MRQILALLLFTTIISCESNNQLGHNTIGALPKLVDIDSLKSTEFVPTMESKIASDKNSIYCPTLLYAWSEIKKVTGELKVQEGNYISSIVELQNSKAYEDALAKSEYTTEVEINGLEISSKAEFNSEVTFQPHLEKIEFPIEFKQKNVAGFGMINWNYEIADQLHILYYLDNDNFIFKINPEQKDNEIIFVKGTEFEKASTFKDLSNKVTAAINFGNKEFQNKKNLWKYKLHDPETFAIPEISFNIEKSYKELIGQSVYNNQNTYSIKVAKQRNALLLNNKGAKIESDAEVAYDAAAAQPMQEKIIEKHLLLDKTFYIIFKHNSKTNPYFICKICTDELMIKH